MHQSIGSTTSIVFMIICTILSKPMYLDKNIDTELRLGTSSMKTITIPKVDELDRLKLTLAPPSDLTTKDVVSSKDHRLSGALGIQKTDTFKHPPQQKQSFRFIPDVTMWLNDGNIQLIRPVSHLLGDHHNAMTYNNLMLKAFPSGFPTHHLQGSGSRNLQIHQVPTHGLPKSSGSSSAQGFPTRASSAKDISNLIEVQHPTIIDLPSHRSQHRDMERALEKTGVPGKDSSGYKKSRASRARKEVVIKPNGGKTYMSARDTMTEWSGIAKDELSKHGGLGGEMTAWFDDLRVVLLNKLPDDESFGIKPSDITRVIGRAENKLTNIFLGFLITNHPGLGGRNNGELLRDGWEYLKSYITRWHHVNLKVLLSLKEIKADGEVWEWTSDEILAYLMWMDAKNVFSWKLFSRFLIYKISLPIQIVFRNSLCLGVVIVRGPRYIRYPNVDIPAGHMRDVLLEIVQICVDHTKL
ncbi:uncharacterized protein MELLADRAFT_102516 [Melampsora larici-populina 98AG31]|uniref:Secreted protein n=1 Tax=Melampsora larici-populina (strain 98AG31 / pathotype 3-4-7) TaxID=747676 RepID=F4R711_MELLP|nr:uncharacterized protein MELLADRAFT_102516 [Melampsora larici-populina 98AG31]EGG11496.1 hypothetical protein MELLADRAFT_102516 [Melampsora larici-populina 98AG31]